MFLCDSNISQSREICNGVVNITLISILMWKAKPTCYMTNYVHPGIVYLALSQPFNQNSIVHSRFQGIQANTSPLSYEELDGSLYLKCSDPVPFGEEMMKLRSISSINIFGGCCGTDARHMEQVARRLQS